MVEIEEAAEARAPLHVGVRASQRWGSREKPVVESLMVPLAVVVRDVLPREEAHVAFTERDHTIETCPCDRSDEPFGVRVQIETLRRQPDRLDLAARQDVGHDMSVSRDPGRASDGVPSAGIHGVVA